MYTPAQPIRVPDFRIPVIFRKPVIFRNPPLPRRNLDDSPPTKINKILTVDDSAREKSPPVLCGGERGEFTYSPSLNGPPPSPPPRGIDQSCEVLCPENFQ
jgi:hypothetical protein